MADDFTSPSGLATVYDATLDYDIEDSLTDAKRHAKALRAMLRYARSSSQGGNQFDMPIDVMQDELRYCLDYIASKRTLTEAQRKAKPAVLHADFTAFGKYDDGVTGPPRRAT